MRGALCVLFLIACGPSEAPPIEEHDVPVSPDDQWARIEELARPASQLGPATDLDQALLIEDLDGLEWFELQYRDPPPPRSKYPGGERALELLARWTSVRGGFPQRSPAAEGYIDLGMLDLGDLVIATARSRDDLAPAIYMGTLLVTAGDDMLSIRNGITLLERTKKRLATFDGGLDAIPVVELDVVRTLAADATRWVRLVEWYKSPAGAKDVDSNVKVPSDAELAAYKAFWIRALDGAVRGESSVLTRRRLHKAITPGSPVEAERVERYLQTFDSIEQSLIALHPN